MFKVPRIDCCYKDRLLLNPAWTTSSTGCNTWSGSQIPPTHTLPQDQCNASLLSPLHFRMNLNSSTLNSSTSHRIRKQKKPPLNQRNSSYQSGNCGWQLSQNLPHPTQGAWEAKQHQSHTDRWRLHSSPSIFSFESVTFSGRCAFSNNLKYIQ